MLRLHVFLAPYHILHSALNPIGISIYLFPHTHLLVCERIESVCFSRGEIFTYFALYITSDSLSQILSPQIVTLKPRTNPIDLTRIFRKVANRVLDEGGNVRAVVNHGIRILPYRFHSKHSVSESENRWFSSGRWISAYYDAHPAVVKEVEVRAVNAVVVLP